MHKVVVYHSINARETAMPSFMDVSPGRFEKQIRWLAEQKKRVVSLNELVHRRRDEELYAITFDDASRKNLAVALPILEKYALPMTVFVVAGFVGDDNYLSESELRRLSHHPLITIGSHSLTRRRLSQLTSAEAYFELSESKSVLEEMTGANINFLTYPFGDLDFETEAIARLAGYRAAWSVWKGSNSNFSRWRIPLGRQNQIGSAASGLARTKKPVRTRVRQTP